MSRVTKNKLWKSAFFAPTVTLMLAISLLTVPQFVFASYSNWNIDFEDFNTGALNGQNNFNAPNETGCTVTSDGGYSNSQAAFCDSQLESDPSISYYTTNAFLIGDQLSTLFFI